MRVGLEYARRNGVQRVFRQLGKCPRRCPLCQPQRGVQRYPYLRRVKILAVKGRRPPEAADGKKPENTCEQTRHRPLTEHLTLLPSSRLGLSAGRVERHRGPDERLERAFVKLLALVDVDRAPGVPLQARVEEPGRV